MCHQPVVLQQMAKVPDRRPVRYPPVLKLGKLTQRITAVQGLFHCYFAQAEQLRRDVSLPYRPYGIRLAIHRPKLLILLNWPVYEIRGMAQLDH